MLLAPPTRDINKKNAVSHTTHTSEAHAHTGAHACTWPSRCCRRGTRVSLASQAGVQMLQLAGPGGGGRSRGGGCGRSPWSSRLSSETIKGAPEALFAGRGASPWLKETRPDQRGGRGGCLHLLSAAFQSPQSSHQFQARTATSWACFCVYKISQSWSSSESD